MNTNALVMGNVKEPVKGKTMWRPFLLNVLLKSKAVLLTFSC